VEERNLNSLLEGMGISEASMEINMEIPQNLKIELLYDQEVRLLGIHLKKCKSGYNEGNCILVFIEELFTIPKLWKQPHCPLTDE
jgi:hypothetical protein